MNVWVGRIIHSIICVYIHTYIPNVAPVCLCSFLFASLSGSVFNVSISCNPQYKGRHFVTIPLERLLSDPLLPGNSPEVLPLWLGQLRAHQQYICQTPDGAPGSEWVPHQTWNGGRFTKFICTKQEKLEEYSEVFHLCTCGDGSALWWLPSQCRHAWWCERWGRDLAILAAGLGGHSASRYTDTHIVHNAFCVDETVLDI